MKQFKNAKELRDEIFKEIDNSNFQYKGELFYYDENSDITTDTGYIPSHLFWLEDYYNDIDIDSQELIDYFMCDLYDECLNSFKYESKTFWEIYASKYKLAINSLISQLEDYRNNLKEIYG